MNNLQRNQPQQMVMKMTGRRKHPVWTHFDEITSIGKSKRAVCKDCKLSIVALVERMIKHKIACTPLVNENKNFEKKYSIYDPVENSSIASTHLWKDSSSDSNFKHVAKSTKYVPLSLPINQSDKEEFETCSSITNSEKNKLDGQVARMIYTTNSLKIIKPPKFRAMIEMLRPEYKLPNGFNITNKLQADAENQHFNWSQTSEDSYAEANDTNASGYEADSVLASMMHESIDDYHNQEPIVDVQEPQTWSSCRKYRGMQPVTGGDYSDDDGGGYSSRKMMRMSRPDAPSDEFNTFSDYVAERMRNLKADKALQLMARRDIEQVLFKYEMKLLEQKRDSQQHQKPDTEAATTSKSISPSPVSDLEQQ